MSYTVRVHVHQHTIVEHNRFRIVEQTVWHYANGGTWTSYGSDYVLKMGGSGTSGALRFANESEDYFFVVFGVHNYKPWVAIAPSLTSSDTSTKLHPTYYAGGERSQDWQYGSVEKTDGKGRKLSVAIAGEGHDLCAELSIAYA